MTATFQRQFPEAARRMRRAHELDPLSVIIQNEMGWAPFFMGAFDTALECFQRAAAADPSFAMAYYNMGNVHEREGRLGLAIENYRKAVDLSHRSPLIVSALGAALAEAGEHGAAREMLEEIDVHIAQGASLWTWKAAVHQALGEDEDAMDCLERAVEARESPAMLLDTHHFLFDKRLAAQPRYQELRTRVRESLGLDREAE